jgi:hypothetical protein
MLAHSGLSGPPLGGTKLFGSRGFCAQRPFLALAAVVSTGLALALPSIGPAAALPSPNVDPIVVMTDDGSIVVTDGRIDVSKALVTWGSDGVIWAADGARTLEVDPASGMLIEVPISTQVVIPANKQQPDTLASRAAFTCTVYTNNPVAYLSSSPKLIGGQGEQICSGVYVQQRVQARLQTNTAFGWTSGSPWAYSAWSPSSYRTTTGFANCLQGRWQYRANAKGSVQTASGTSSSPVVLSGGEPFYTC